MPGPGQRVKYPRGSRGFFKRFKGLKGLKKSKSQKPETGPSGKPPWIGAKGGRVGKAHGGSVSARLSKSGPVAKAN